VAGITGTYHHIQLIFVFLVETGFYHIDQTGLKLLTSGDQPTSASQSAGITGVNHSAQPCEQINFCCLSLPVCGILFKQPGQTYIPHPQSRKSDTPLPCFLRAFDTALGQPDTVLVLHDYPFTIFKN
uniref:Uncharacterized protein n=1 Tax=Macaca mulatta TaxID=9544 RepID=A0A5F7ZEI7_MACMU